MQCGLGHYTSPVYSPTTVLGISNVVGIAADNPLPKVFIVSHADGTVSSWGDAIYNDIHGVGWSDAGNTLLKRPTPGKVAGVTDAGPMIG